MQRNNLLKTTLSVTFIASLLGCASTIEQPTANPLYTVNPALKKSASLILNGDYEQANETLNQMLSSAPRDPLANLLNGMAYQSRTTGQGTLWDLAKIGYQLAQQFDPHLWQAAYLLGQMQLKERNLSSAITYFTESVLASPLNSTPWYGLAMASYSSGDLRTAYQATSQAMRLDKNNPLPQHRRIAILVFASAGAFELAKSQLQAIEPTENNQSEIKWLEQKIALWQKNYADLNLMPQLSPSDTNTPANYDPNQKKMAVLEAVFIRTSTLKSSHYGVNLLDGLNTQFTGNIVNSGESSTTKTDTSSNNQPTSSATQLFDAVKSSNLYSLTIPAITYTLNIANSVGTQSEMIARPTVLALNGKTSKFFIGNETTVFMGGSFSSASFTKEYGLSVQVTPIFLSANNVELQVDMGFSTLKDGSPAGLIQNSSAILLAKANSSTSAVMRMGQTLAVTTSSLYQEDSNVSQVPLLGDVPLIGKFFSRNSASISEGSLLVLLTLKNTVDNSASQKTYNNTLPTRLIQQLPAVDATISQNLNQLAQKDVLTFIRPQDVEPLIPIAPSESDSSSSQWQQQFVDNLLLGM